CTTISSWRSPGYLGAVPNPAFLLPVLTPARDRVPCRSYQIKACNKLMLQSSVAIEFQARLSKTGTAMRQRAVEELH
ncbi:MAG: hypothetical protein VXW46_07045, partial [Pseudomonadota bacterium]|nr:hypothetical protein [Pseudomonadota bacterium]